MIYAVGDIHGKSMMLRSLLDGLPFTPDDTLLFLGDYIDRGEDSCAVVEMLIDLQAQHEHCIFLRGNHEQMLLEARDGPPPHRRPFTIVPVYSEPMQLWLQNGGSDALASYGADDPFDWWDALPETHWKFFRATQMEHITDAYHFVHAGIALPGERWEGMEYGLDSRLWIREPFLDSEADYDGRVVVFGHTPQTTGRPLIHANKIGIDTGAVFGGPLTAAALDPDAAGEARTQGAFYQVTSQT